MTCYHRLGAIGTKFVIRVRARSPSGLLEDMDLAGAQSLHIDFRRPDGTSLQREARKEGDSNDIYWKDTEGILTQRGTWSMSASVRYGEADYVRAVGTTLFHVI